jgi:hypothetical protein
MFLSIIDQSALKRKFGIKMEQRNGGWAKLLNVVAHSFSYSTDKIMLIRLGGNEGNKNKCFVDKPQE